MELLEREGALSALTAARAAAAGGEGRVVLVTGEPGIGKTALVGRFVRDLGPGARVLLGTCDDLIIPRPLGPVRDLAGTVSPPLERALADGAPAHEVQALLLAELELPPRPTVLVLEDVHWADEATLDSITVLGRRIGSLPALLVLTFRGGEAPPTHALRAAIGALRPADTVFVELAPLSEDAVASLAGENAGDIYAVTRGNPFYVTELMVSGTADELPPSVANAVLGRAARLDEPARRLVELVSVVPRRVATAVLDAVMPDWAAAAEEPERRELLEVDPRWVRFRHELARHAIRASVPVAVQRRLHAEILEALLGAGADPAEIVHHAEAAGARDVVAGYALVAARRAARVGSHREAYSHYRRAADFLDQLPAAERAAALEELANAAYVVGRLGAAHDAVEQAAAIHRDLGDREAVGRCTRMQSRFHWFGGESAPAREKAREAVEILEPLGESPVLARAYSSLSQLAMLAHDIEAALGWGERALALGERVGDESTRVHALVNLATVRVQLDAADPTPLLEAHEQAHAAGDAHEATRALANLGYTLLCWVEPEQATVHTLRALEYAREYEMHNLASYVATTLAWLRLRAGAWEDAERTTRAELEKGMAVPQLVARTVLAELAVRRGDADAAARLAELAAQAERAGDLQRMTPVLELQTELGLTAGAAMPLDRYVRLAGELRRRDSLVGWGGHRVAAWAAVAGADVELDDGEAPPVFAAMRSRDWRAAADAFGAVGWTYDRALMLSLTDDEDALAEAIGIARALGAGPLTRRLARRLRGLGLSVPQGPRPATRANPAGLTARQLKVLSLLGEGLTNAEIAERLVVSPRTAEHHVAAVLAKLGAPTRRDAARRAAELGI